jgi:hypothetical protein
MVFRCAVPVLQCAKHARKRARRVSCGTRCPATATVTCCCEGRARRGTESGPKGVAGRTSRGRTRWRRHHPRTQPCLVCEPVPGCRGRPTESERTESAPTAPGRFASTMGKLATWGQTRSKDGCATSGRPRATSHYSLRVIDVRIRPLSLAIQARGS